MNFPTFVEPMILDSVVLPDYYSGGKTTDLYVHHFTTDEPYVRHNIVLKQNLICILLEGTKEVFGSHDSIRIDNREILLMSSGSSIMVHSAIGGVEKLESMLLFFSNDLLKEFSAKYKLDFAVSRQATPSVFSVRKNEFLLNFETSLKLLEVDAYSATMQKLKLEELLLYLTVKNPSGKFHAFLRNALVNTVNDKLRNIVAANCSNGLGSEELAFLCDMSISTFNRHFIKIFGCAPKKYLTEKRMEKARELLQFNSRPSEIYRELRYQSLSSFSTEFRKYFGISPRQFQKEMSSI